MRENKSALGFSQLGADLVRIKGLSILLLNIKKISQNANIQGHCVTVIKQDKNDFLP